MDKQTEEEIRRRLEAKLDGMSPAKLKQIADNVSAIHRKQKEDRLSLFEPNDAQIAICNSRKKIISISGGNRSGKTHIAGYIVACHVTGRYPDWWDGYRFTRPVNFAVIAPTYDQMRRSSQLKLFGEVDEFGTGFIPKECIIGEPSFKAQKNGALDIALIKHISGGTSRLIALTLEQQLKAFAGFQLDGGWFDEEPGFDKFDETRMRMLDRGGVLILSYCPQDGMTELIKHLNDTPDQYISHFYLTPQDNPHLNKEEVEYFEASTPDWLKEYRKYGRPGTGEGRVFYFDKSLHVCEPFEVEPHWRVIGGFDPARFGHHTAAVKLVIDDESKTVYVTAEYNAIEQLPPVHASALKRWGDMDFKIDTSSHARESNGENLFDFYVKEGLNVSNADKSLDVSLNLINMYLSEGRLLIFSTCKELINQMLLYRGIRNDKTGEFKIVRKDNDIVDALRYAFMGLDEARVPGVNMKHKVQLPPVKEWKPFDTRLGV